VVLLFLLLDHYQCLRCERGDHVLLPIRLPHELVVRVSQLAYFLIPSKLSAREKKSVVIGFQFNMVFSLLAVEELPALDAKDLAVAFAFDFNELLDERVPLGRVAFDHDLF